MISCFDSFFSQKLLKLWRHFIKHCWHHRKNDLTEKNWYDTVKLTSSICVWKIFNPLLATLRILLESSSQLISPGKNYHIFWSILSFNSLIAKLFFLVIINSILLSSSLYFNLVFPPIFVIPSGRTLMQTSTFPSFFRLLSSSEIKWYGS